MSLFFYDEKPAPVPRPTLRYRLHLLFCRQCRDRRLLCTVGWKLRVGKLR